MANYSSSNTVKAAQSLLKRLDAIEAAIALKSINEVLREYQDKLERYIVDTVNGNMTASEMSRAHKSLIKRLAVEVYQEGMREGGVRDPESEMEDEDDEAIDDWISDQAQYTLDFAKSCEEASLLKGDERRTQRDLLIDRASDWSDSLRNLGQKGYLSAKGNLPLTYDGDDGEESCDECQQYKGQRHRKSWWEKRDLLSRPNTKYTCGRYKHCHHHFFNDDGDQVMD